MSIRLRMSLVLLLVLLGCGSAAALAAGLPAAAPGEPAAPLISSPAIDATATGASNDADWDEGDQISPATQHFVMTRPVDSRVPSPSIVFLPSLDLPPRPRSSIQ